MAPFNFIAHTVLYLLYFNYLYKIYSKEIKKDREKLGFFLKKYFEKILSCNTGVFLQKTNTVK